MYAFIIYKAELYITYRYIRNLRTFKLKKLTFNLIEHLFKN